MSLKRVYDVTLSLLTPLHIGSGKELGRDFDYVTHAGRTWVMNSDAFLEHLQKPDGSFDERILGRPASELLQAGDYQDDSPFFRYVLDGMPRSEQYGAVVREQYKDAFDRPYIPGSSIKGSLRTVLAWQGFQEAGLKLDVNDLRGSRSWAGQGYERQIFGRDPNHDLLRALQIADTEPTTQERLQLVNAQVVTGGEKLGSPIEVEAVRSDTVFRTTFVVDEFLHTAEAEQELRFGRRWRWLTDLPAIARSRAAQQIAQERDWFRSRKYDNVGRFYHQLLTVLKRNQLKENQFVVQIGWGGGWNSKTIGAPLQQEDQAWERLLNDKRLSPSRFRRAAGAEFPKSRRAVMAMNQPAAPLGWCLVEMEERG